MADVEGAVPEAPQPDPLPSSGHAGELTADAGAKHTRTSFHASVAVKDEALAEGAAASPKPGKPTVNISFRKQMSIGGAKTPKSQGGATPKGSLEVPRPQTSTSAAILAAQAAINRAKATGAAAPPAEAVVAVEKGWHMYGPEHVKPRSEVGGPAQIQISAATKEEAAKRKAYRANKEAAMAKRAAEEAARKAKEAAALAAAQEAKAAAHAQRVAERRAKYEAFMARDKAAAQKSEESWKKYMAEKDKAPLLYRTMEEEYRARQAAEEAARKAAYDEEVARLKLLTYNQIINGELANVVPSRSTSPSGGRTSPHGLRNSQELRSSGMLSPGAITRSASPHGGHHHAGGYGAKAGSPTAGGGLQWRTGLSPQLLERACSPIVFPSDGSTPPGCREVPTYKARQTSMQRQQQQHEPEVAAFDPEPEQEEQEEQEVAAHQSKAASRAASIKQQQQAEDVEDEEQEEQPAAKAPSRGASLHQHQQEEQEEQQQADEMFEEEEQQQEAPARSTSQKPATRQMSSVRQEEAEEEPEDAAAPAAEEEEAPAADLPPPPAAAEPEPAADEVGGEEPAAAVDVAPPAKPAEVAAEEAEEGADVAPAEEVAEAPAKAKAPEPDAEEVDG